MGVGLATELEWLRDALLGAIRDSSAEADQISEVLARAGLPGLVETWIFHRPGEVASGERLASLLVLRANHPQEFSDLWAIAAQYAPARQPARKTSGVTARGTRSVAAGGAIGVAVTGDGSTHVAGDHIDFRDATFHDRVVGVQYNHYGPVPAPAEWRPVGTVGLREFGVRPTRPVSGLPDVPPYVPRDCDDDLRAKLAGNSLVLILGEPCAGTSYTAWHGVRSLTGHRLYAPAVGEDLRPLAAALRGNPGRSVVWLDKLTGHLGERGLDPSLLGGLNDLGAVVLATMSPADYYRRRKGAAPGDLVVAAARTVELAREWSEAELGRLAALDDPRAYPAFMWSGREGVASYFAIGHHLYDEWRRVGTQLEHPRGQLLVRAAVDLARCGVTGAVSAELLRRVQEQYRAEDRESFEDALAWATAPMFGASGLLVEGEEEGSWRAYGALVAEALRSGDLEPVPDDVWWALLDAARDEDEHSNLDADAVYDAARTALQPRIEAGDPTVALAFALRIEGVEHEMWLRRAADSGHPEGAWKLAQLLLDRGDADDAVPYLEVAAQSGNGDAATALGKHLRDQARWWLEKAADGGNLEAEHLLGDLLFGSGDYEAAHSRYSGAEMRGYAKVARSMGAWLLLENAGKAAEVWLERAVAAGDAGAGGLLSDARRGPQPAEEADTYFDDSGPYPLDSTHRGVLLEKQGQLGAAREKYEKGYEKGDAYAAYRLAALLEKQGSPGDAKAWYRKAADMGHYAALEALGELPGTPDTVKE